MEKSTKNIYLFNLLKSPQINFDQGDSFLISRVLDLTNSIQLNRVELSSISSKFLKILKMSGHEFWSSTDRVCLVKSIAFSNQFQILSSAHNDNLLLTGMDAGYTCVISEETSLRKLKKGEVRICDDIDQILNSYTARNLRPQRSIKKLADAGCRSSIAMPLYFQDQHLGYLFLNSAEFGVYSKLKDEDYSLLCLFQTVFENILINDKNQNMELQMFKSLTEIENKNRIQILQLKNTLESFSSTFLGYPISFSISVDNNFDVLIPHRKFCLELFLIFKQYFSNSHPKKIELKFVELKKEKMFLSLISDVDFSLFSFDPNLNQLPKNISCTVDKFKIDVLFNCELTDQSCDYSILDFN